MNILVVDDDWMNRELMEAVLNSAGYQVTLANNIQKAVEIATATPPDLALVDIRLQGENDGFELCRRLKTDFPRIKVMMVTALENGDTEAQARAAGADDFVNRFIEMSLLLERIETLLKGSD